MNGVQTTSEGASEMTGILERLEKLGVSDKFAQSVEAITKAKSISTALIVMRHKAGLTQSDVAEKMNVSQSKIAKIERTVNAGLRMGDIEAYVWSVGGSLDIATHGKEGSFVVHRETLFMSAAKLHEAGKRLFSKELREEHEGDMQS